jgi:hypothetical protein
VEHMHKSLRTSVAKTYLLKIKDSDPTREWNSQEIAMEEEVLYPHQTLDRDDA